jgi:DNA-binding NarL/FixJ family response regulator
MPHLETIPFARSILLADDSPAIRKMMRSFFESTTDLEVCGEAVDGLDAIEKAQKLKPDLVILDVEMPRMNGLEAARLLNQLMPGTPLVLFTLSEGTINYSCEPCAGIKAVIAKSDGMDALVEQVRGVLESA